MKLWILRTIPTDYILAACIAAGACVYLWLNSRLRTIEIGDPLGAQFLPNLVGAGLLLSAVILFFETRTKASAPPESVQSDGDEEVAHPKRTVVLLAVTAWTLVYYMCMEDVGFILSTLVYMIVFLAFINKGKWALNITLSVVFTLVSYVGFAKLLGVFLPHGILWF